MSNLKCFEVGRTYISDTNTDREDDTKRMILYIKAVLDIPKVFDSDRLAQEVIAEERDINGTVYKPQKHHYFLEAFIPLEDYQIAKEIAEVIES